MILSMTGFGQAKGSVSEKEITVEIKSLNGKSADIRMKLPIYFREKELLIRKLILNHAGRGKFDVNINITSEDGNADLNINKALFKKYYKDLDSIHQELGTSNTEDWTGAILRIPEVLGSANDKLEEEQWNQIREIIISACKNLESFRAVEGKALASDLVLRVNNIKSDLEAVTPFEKARIDNLRVKLQKNLDEWKVSEHVDQNRYEQEIIYYLEKLDITEEKVRLAQHCKYFLEILNQKDLAIKGKKLGFVGQEMGREINTLGSKAQHAGLQKLVVNMKDSLEKIKEQILNVV